MESLVRFDRVTKIYGSGSALVRALPKMGREGRAVGLLSVMGPSGCGKTTILNLIAGLDQPNEGTVAVAGKDLEKLTETERSELRPKSPGSVFPSFTPLPPLS